MISCKHSYICTSRVLLMTSYVSFTWSLITETMENKTCTPLLNWSHVFFLKKESVICWKCFSFFFIVNFDINEQHSFISCLNFCDESWWFLSWRVFGLLSSSLLLFLENFGRYVHRPSSGVCRTREPTRNLELRPLSNPRRSP